MSRKLGIAVVGAGWMGRVHSEAYRRLPGLLPLPGAELELRWAVDRDPDLSKRLAERYGFTRSATDWEDILTDPGVDVVDVCLPNAHHRDVVMAATEAGKHILCEKPLGRDPADSEDMYRAATKAGVCHQTAFNYRRVPALAQARRLIESGQLGELYQFRGQFCQDFAADPHVPISWRFASSTAGAGSLGTLGAHLLDLTRWLMGDVRAMAGASRTFVTERPDEAGRAVPVDVDDTGCLVVRFAGRAIGLLETSWVAHGRRCQLEVEVQGSRGSLLFTLERMNELQWCEGDGPPDRRGFRTIYMGAPHPYGGVFELKPGMNLGWRDTFVLQAYEFLSAVLDGRTPTPSFYDGWQVDRLIHTAVLATRADGWLDVAPPQP